MDFGLKGKVAMVAGASRGLGFAVARGLAAEGAHVSISSRGEAAIAAAGDRIARETGAAVLATAVDVRSAESLADWQAGWSRDGRVLGIWTADSVGSSWGRLTVLAIDPTTGAVADTDPLLPTTLARRGFSLGNDRVAWVAPSSSNVDGELRLRAWTSDGVGGLRVVSPEQEEVLPAF